MEEYMPKSQSLQMPSSSTQQIDDRELGGSTQPVKWQPHVHNHHNQPGNQLPVRQHIQHIRQSGLGLSHDEVKHLKNEALQFIAQERQHLNEAEQILAMPGFVKAFEIFLRVYQQK